MTEDHRLSSIRSLVTDYVRSPSLRHVRDPFSIAKLAREILRAVDRPVGPWEKWDGLRDAELTAAATTWIPIEDLRQYLNTVPGARLTQTDVEQRLLAIQEERYDLYPDSRMQAACLARYKLERDAGTEMSAIIRALSEFSELESERMRVEQERSWKETRAKQQEALRQRLLSGADCKWISLEGPSEYFCRTNGRLFRLTKGKDLRWTLSRVQAPQDKGGDVLGVYATRGEATKVVAKIAYQPEPRW